MVKRFDTLPPLLHFKTGGASCECPHIQWVSTHTHIHRWWQSLSIVGAALPIHLDEGLVCHWRQSYYSQHCYLSIAMTQHHYPCQILIAFIHFLGFVPRHLFWILPPELFCCHKNRQKYSLRSTCWWQFFDGHWWYLRLDQRIRTSPSADIVIFNLCSCDVFICNFDHLVWNEVKLLTVCYLKCHNTHEQFDQSPCWCHLH